MEIMEVILIKLNGKTGYNNDSNLSFQTFSYQESQYSQPSQQYSSYSTNYPQKVTLESIRSAFSCDGLGNEPPLLQELGINFQHILSKSLVVLNPLKSVEGHLMDDADLAGPLIFCFLFGGLLLLSGKAHFEYIYGVAVVGVLSIYGILNLMSENGIDIYRSASVMGYSLLPVVLFTSLSTIMGWSGYLVLGISLFSIIWCTYSASLIFTTVLAMDEVRLLVAYPIALVYSAFVLLAVF